MTPIARRGDLVAWADEDFEPVEGEVELRTASGDRQRVRWQSALKWGYWEPYDADQDE
jgi:hypothetical protein